MCDSRLEGRIASAPIIHMCNKTNIQSDGESFRYSGIIQ
ncbi:hypothetical protein EMIT0158MI4_20518 [Burkholderia ambifaria]